MTSDSAGDPPRVVAETLRSSGPPPVGSAVEVEHLSRHFGEVAAVDDVSLTVRRGEFFSLLGPSGCGKTTLLRIVGGFDTASGGEVRIHGHNVLNEPPYLRRTNMIFQHLALFPHMTCSRTSRSALR